jgi:hypothetical protein
MLSRNWVFSLYQACRLMSSILAEICPFIFASVYLTLDGKM